MHLSQKLKTFCQYFIAFLESTLNILNKNLERHSLSISEIIPSEKRNSLNV